jgi:hypothetical protein
MHTKTTLLAGAAAALLAASPVSVSRPALPSEQSSPAANKSTQACYVENGRTMIRIADGNGYRANLESRNG